MGYLKTGSAVHSEYEKVDKQDQVREEQARSPYRNRFWLPENKSAKMTFLDGFMDKTGLLQTVSYWEHQVELNGTWRNWFVCVSEEEPCPICEERSRPSFVSVFTVIDHSQFTDGEGHLREHERKLFIAKKDTFKLLQQMASNRGGLAGNQFEVSRIGSKAAAVGSNFDFIRKYKYEELLAECTGMKPKGEDGDKKVARPYEYERIILYKKAHELKEMGFGGMPAVGSDNVNQQLAGSAGDSPLEIDDDSIPF